MLDLRYRYQVLVFNARILMLDIQLWVTCAQIWALNTALRFMEKHVLSEEDLADLRKEGRLQ